MPTHTPLLPSEPRHCQDGSLVTYFMKDGQEWVKQINTNGNTRYSKFSIDGKWMSESMYKQL